MNFVRMNELVMSCFHDYDHMMMFTVVTTLNSFTARLGAEYSQSEVFTNGYTNIVCKHKGY